MCYFIYIFNVKQIRFCFILSWHNFKHFLRYFCSIQLHFKLFNVFLSVCASYTGLFGFIFILILFHISQYIYFFVYVFFSFQYNFRSQFGPFVRNMDFLYHIKNTYLNNFLTVFLLKYSL